MGKLTKIFFIKFILCAAATGWLSKTVAQDTALNKYGLWVISDISVYGLTVKNNPAKEMTDIRKIIPNMGLDLRYATKNNFLKKKLYPRLKTTYLRSKAAMALALVQKELNEKGYGLKIFDAYRPYTVTEMMWEPIQDDRYTADPKKGSGHNRGAAVDLTIINLAAKKELDMGTGFDNFSDTAHHSFTSLPDDVLQNRLLLKNTMEKYGFKSFETEWWHYSLPDIKEYELLNISFEDLKKMQRRK